MAQMALDEIKGEQPGLEGVIEKVTDSAKFVDYRVMMTPGLVINDRLVSSGRIPAPSQIAEWMREALAEE